MHYHVHQLLEHIRENTEKIDEVLTKFDKVLVKHLVLSLVVFAKVEILFLHWLTNFLSNGQVN